MPPSPPAPPNSDPCANAGVMNIEACSLRGFPAPRRRLNFARTIAAARPIATLASPSKWAICGHFSQGRLLGQRRPAKSSPNFRKQPNGQIEVQIAAQVSAKIETRRQRRGPGDVLERIATALERLAPRRAAAADFDAADAFVWHPDGRLAPVARVNRVEMSLLKGIDRVRDVLVENTERFAKGLPANNALLWGARGMGKSSLVKASHAAVNADLGSGKSRGRSS